MRGSSSNALAITRLGHATVVLRTPERGRVGHRPLADDEPRCSDAWKQIRRANGTVPHVTGTPDQLRVLVEPQGVTVLESQPGGDGVVRTLRTRM